MNFFWNISKKRHDKNDICMKFKYSAITSFWQRAKKVMSDSLGLLDFAIRLVNFVFNLSDRQVIFFEQLE